MITLEKINKKIIEWQNNLITKERIQSWADNLWGTAELDELYELDNNAQNEFIITEILYYLEFINMNLITKDDIPQLLKFLNSKDNYLNSYKDLDQYFGGIDYRKRAEELKDDPFYREYCMSILNLRTKNPSKNNKNKVGETSNAE